jgi:hypothetical protein
LATTPPRRIDGCDFVYRVLEKKIQTNYNGNNEKHRTMSKRQYCAITGIKLTEEDTYSEKSCSYANFVEGFRARHKIPVADLRLFVATLKRKL